MFELMQRNAGPIRSLFGDPILGAGVEDLLEDLRAAIARGDMPPLDANYMAGAMAGVALELGVRMAEREPPDVEGAARFATELFLGGIARLGAGALSRAYAELRRAQPQQLEQLGAAVERVGDRRAAVERVARPAAGRRPRRRAPRPTALGRSRAPPARDRRLRIGGAGVAQRHPVTGVSPLSGRAVRPGLASQLAGPLSTDEKVHRSEHVASSRRVRN